MTNKQSYLLISKYLNNPEDATLKQQVEAFRSSSKANDELFTELELLWEQAAKAYLLEKINIQHSLTSFTDKITDNASFKKTKKLSLWKKPLAKIAVAIILLVTSVSIYIYTHNTMVKSIVYTSDIGPGGEKATLTLANGEKISLTDAKQGDIAKQAGLSISKTENGEIIYTVIDDKSLDKANKTGFNTIETPNGGTWQVHLPDGTTIWLNAVSSIKYPLSFKKSKFRTVELKGEAYFEVAKNENKPFIVKTEKQEIRVLGTHFNINSYNDEEVVKTTLLEGSVKVLSLADRQEVTLKPNEQAVLSNNSLSVVQVDAEKFIDWKKGYFFFNNEKQEHILKKISRWYNVKIIYADEAAKNITYYGSVSRFDKISKILTKFEQTGEVQFQINKNTITVYSKTH